MKELKTYNWREKIESLGISDQLLEKATRIAKSRDFGYGSLIEFEGMIELIRNGQYWIDQLNVEQEYVSIADHARTSMLCGEISWLNDTCRHPRNSLDDPPGLEDFLYVIGRELALAINVLVYDGQQGLPLFVKAGEKFIDISYTQHHQHSLPYVTGLALHGGLNDVYGTIPEWAHQTYVRPRDIAHFDMVWCDSSDFGPQAKLKACLVRQLVDGDITVDESGEITVHHSKFGEFDSDSNSYPAELDIAMQVWRAAVVGCPDQKPKAWMVSWLAKHYPDLNKEECSRIATVANWDKARGRPQKKNNRSPN